MATPPKDFKYATFKKAKPRDLVVDPKMEVNMTFLHNHYTHYPKLSLNSKDDKVMRDRINMIRQMTTGITKTAASMKAAIKSCKSPQHDKFKLMLDQYLELLRKAERDRQNWIKIERGLGNVAHLQEMILGDGLEDVIRI